MSRRKKYAGLRELLSSKAAVGEFFVFRRAEVPAQLAAATERAEKAEADVVAALADALECAMESEQVETERDALRAQLATANNRAVIATAQNERARVMVEHRKEAAASLEKVVLAVEAERDALAARLKGWEDYFGCSSPRDSHAQGNTALGKEQVRANALSARVAELEGAGERLCNFAWSGVTVSWNRKDRASEAEAYLQANIDAMRSALASTAPQSLAKVKAAALREVADERFSDGLFVPDSTYYTAAQIREILYERAAFLESEADHGAVDS